ncbi:hypothetical protein JTB14_031848 [Gonioctena quinquepunctata]|nr:hypothetical protein JTB14_031848 [Gonioctena quinquepunctata]
MVGTHISEKKLQKQSAVDEFKIIARVKGRLEENNGIRNEEFNLERRRLRDESNPFELTGLEFVRLLRADRETARYIINTLRDRLSPSRSDGLSPEIKKLSRDISVHHKNEFLDRDFFSQWANHQPADVYATFLGPAGFPGILGCIDFTHVAIVTPYAQEDAFKNYHGYYSLNMQMVCNEQLGIMNVNANFSESVHDQFIFDASQVILDMHYKSICCPLYWMPYQIHQKSGRLEDIAKVPMLDIEYDIGILQRQGNNRDGYAEDNVDGQIVRNHIITTYFND